MNPNDTGTIRVSNKAYGIDWPRIVRLILLAAAIAAFIAVKWG